MPAYNEAGRIGRVLDVLSTYQGFDEVIVVDDGSTDNTAEVVARYPVRFMQNAANKGKGYSMDVGVNAAQSDVIFFADADVVGLTHKIIDEITAPVLKGEADMFIGMRNRKIYLLHQVITFTPLLGGERAITKALWQKLPDYYKHRFRTEAGLNFYALYYGEGYQFKVFAGLSQVIKEKKYGLWQGTKQRWKMFYNIAAAECKLQFSAIPPSARNSRLLAFVALEGLIGMVIGAVVFAAAYFAPTNFRAVDTVLVAGLLIFAVNLAAFLLTFKKLSFLAYGLSQKVKSNKT